MPAECHGVQPPSGICVKGATWYRLESGQVKWVDDRKSPAQNVDFWNDQEKWGGGANETSSGGNAGASK